MACVLADHLLRHRAQNPDAPATARLPRPGMALPGMALPARSE